MMNFISLRKVTLGLVLSVGLAGCGGPIDKAGMDEIRSRFDKPIYLVVPDEDSPETYKEWSEKKADRGIIGTAYLFRSNYDKSSGIYKFLKKHDLLVSKNVSPPSRAGSFTFQFTFFTPKIKHLLRNVDKEMDDMSFNGNYHYNIPVGKRNLIKVYDVEVEIDIDMGGEKIREYNFTFDYELESTHPLFEAPCKQYSGEGKIGSYGKDGWDVGYLHFDDKSVNEFLNEQECRKGKAFDFPN